MKKQIKKITAGEINLESKNPLWLALRQLEYGAKYEEDLKDQIILDVDWLLQGVDGLDGTEEGDPQAQCVLLATVLDEQLGKGWRKIRLLHFSPA